MNYIVSAAALVVVSLIQGRVGLGAKPSRGATEVDAIARDAPPGTRPPTTGAPQLSALLAGAELGGYLFLGSTLQVRSPPIAKPALRLPRSSFLTRCPPRCSGPSDLWPALHECWPRGLHRPAHHGARAVCRRLALPPRAVAHNKRRVRPRLRGRAAPDDGRKWRGRWRDDQHHVGRRTGALPSIHPSITPCSRRAYSARVPRP